MGYQHRVKLQFIAPGKPIQNAYIESFNARLREECFNEHLFLSLDDARTKIEHWRIAYNRERGRTQPWAILRRTNSRPRPSPRGTRLPRAPLGQRKKCWPSRRMARSPRFQNLTVFRPP
jgi:hypothetical protein